MDLPLQSAVAGLRIRVHHEMLELVRAVEAGTVELAFVVAEERPASQGMGRRRRRVSRFRSSIVEPRPRDRTRARLRLARICPAHRCGGSPQASPNTFRAWVHVSIRRIGSRRKTKPISRSRRVGRHQHRGLCGRLLRPLTDADLARCPAHHDHRPQGRLVARLRRPPQCVAHR